MVIVNCPDGSVISHTFEQVITAVNSDKAVYASIYGTTLIPLNYIADDNSYVEFHTITTKVDENQNTIVQISGLRINNDNTFIVKSTNLSSIIENKKDRDLIVTYAQGSTFGVTHSAQEIYEAVQNGTTVYFQKDTELLNLMEVTSDYATFFMFYMSMEGKPQQKVVVISGSSIMLDQDDTYDYATVTQLNNKADKTALNSYYNKTEVDNLLSSVGPFDDVLLKTEQTLTDAELTQVRSNLKFIGKDVAGQTFNIDGTDIVASANAEIFGDYDTNIAVGQWSIAEGSGTLAKGRASHVEGAYGKALADGTHVEGYGCTATGYWSHAEGLATTVSGSQSHAEGRYTIAAGGAQHVEGIANIEDAEGKYIHIAGNGTFDNRSNAYTLDWNGNGWYAGDVEASAIVLRSSTPGSTKKFRITIDDSGVLTASEVE